MSSLELVERAKAERERTALIDADGATTYAELLRRSESIAAALLGDCEDLEERRVAYLIEPGRDWVATCWGVWRAGGIAVPLAVSHPPPELAALLADARPECLIASTGLQERARRAAGGLPLLTPSELVGRGDQPLPGLVPERRALMVYTSGTTGRPKGVVTTHANVRAQLCTLVDAWEWSPSDRILHVLPLHHVHGIINALSCALWSGACCELLAPFDAIAVWERLASGEITLFMAVPTIYRRLVREWRQAEPETRRRWSEGASGLRLMVSGSAALPAGTLERWQQITGHRLLERYGMTEIGMGLGNPLRGERRAGTVGQPFPGVEARIVDDRGEPVEAGSSGQIQVRGPQVFLEYWDRPDETSAAFRDGWFDTGDEGLIDDGYWRIVGRRSVDIIKTGGYKVSALEIEEALRSHASVSDAAVVGREDPDWGERVCAAVVLRQEEIGADELRGWCKDRLAPYKVPKEICLVAELPRNAMGKVVKKAVVEMLATLEGRE